MKTNYFANKVNYLLLFSHLAADSILEVRLVRNSWLVRFTRGNVRFALFVKTSVVLAKLQDGIDTIEQYLDKRRNQVTVRYNSVSKKFFAVDILTQQVIDIFTVGELGQSNLSILIADLNQQAQSLRKPATKNWFTQNLAS
jgi:hypothetical protein